MALRSGHGTGAGVPRVEVLPADELPAGVPDDARPESPSDRGVAGRFAPGNSGGCWRPRASRDLAPGWARGLATLPEGDAFAPTGALRRRSGASSAPSCGRRPIVIAKIGAS